jgi:hypothetical protein
MRLPKDLHTPRVHAFVSAQALVRNFSRGISPASRRLFALAFALFLLPLGGHKLFAQAPPEPDANMDQPYNPNAPVDSGQPQAYAQAQPPSYPQGSYSGPTSYPQQPAYGQPQSQPQSQPQALSADQLEQLVAPIALYPDALIAQILAASTYPGQIADADRWRQAQGSASSDQIAAGASVQNWDPSVKALTAFPQVLSNLDANLAWTNALGNAYYNQPQDVFQAIQVMRQRAQDAGSLQTTPQQQVTDNQGYVQIAPANPQVVYVPVYNPWAVYGQPVSPYPGFSFFGALGSFFNSSTLRFGVGMAMSAFNNSPWGWLGWGLNWLTQNVLFNQSNYYSHSNSVSDWGLQHGGPRAYTGQRSLAGNYGQPARGYNSTPGSTMPRSPNSYAGNYPHENRGMQSSAFGSARPPETWNRTPQSLSRPQTYSQSYTRPAFNSGFNNYNYSARPSQTYNSSLQAYNHNPIPVSRPQTYSPAYNRPAYSSGSNTYNPGYNSRSTYATRPAQTYGSAFQSYRAPSTNYQRSDYGQHSSFMGNSYMGASARPQSSSGFHLFGSGHSSDNPYGGHSFKEPKSFSQPKFSEPKFKEPKFKEPKFNESRSFGGGHSGGFHPFGGGHGGGGGHHRL